VPHSAKGDAKWLVLRCNEVFFVARAFSVFGEVYKPKDCEQVACLQISVCRNSVIAGTWQASDRTPIHGSHAMRERGEMRRNRLLAVSLLAALALNSFLAGVSAIRLREEPPAPVEVTPGLEAKLPPPASQPILSPRPESAPRNRPTIPANDFPSGPPKPAVSDVPPPLSPSGRWLHTLVEIDGKAFVYGGVGSYSSALFNDMWVYNYSECTLTVLVVVGVLTVAYEPFRG